MRYAASLVLACMLQACSGAPAPAGSAGPEATGFITVNSPAPDGAADSRGDGVMRDAYGRPFGYALLGARLPAFSAPMLGGGTFNSADIDRWTIIDVWGVWCGDCRADGPYTDALSRAVAADPELDFISVHVPASAARTSEEEMYGKFGSVEAYFESVGYRYPVVIDADAGLREALKISWTPSYLLVSPDGVVRGFRTELAVAGGEPVNDFLRAVAQVKAQTPAAPTIGPDGVMQLQGPAVFTLPAIEAAFPGFQAVSGGGLGADGGSVFQILDASAAVLFTIEPDWTRGYVGAVVTAHPGVRGTGGEAVGRTRLADLPAAERARCTSLSSVQGRWVCVSVSGRGTFHRVFDRAPQEAGPVLTEMRFEPAAGGTGTP